MTRKERTIRIVVNGALLAMIVALGITVYQSGSEGRKQKELAQQKEVQWEEEQAKLSEEEEEPMVDADTSQVEAEMSEDAQMDSSSEKLAQADSETAEWETAEAKTQQEAVEMEQEPAAAAIPVVDFTEDTLMIWPLSGDVLLDYSMDQTIYHPTLDVYKYSPGIVISAAEGSEVLAAANGTVESLREDAETGTTVTLDMGNGYRASYGQLENVLVQEGQTVGQSTILGYVAQPTKYYSVEGTNLYFAMSKDGTPIDPITYLP